VGVRWVEKPSKVKALGGFLSLKVLLDKWVISGELLPIFLSSNERWTLLREADISLLEGQIADIH